jgi:NTP pyrophosphatase (non-canonical NTP hydrolase)
MTLDEYQAAALSTAIYPTERRIVYPALGLSGESGEVADKIKKVIRDHHAEFSEQQCRDIAIELGDVLWYCAAMARDLGFSLDEVAQMNVDKLKSRRQRGAIHGSGDNR